MRSAHPWNWAGLRHTETLIAAHGCKEPAVVLKFLSEAPGNRRVVMRVMLGREQRPCTGKFALSHHLHASAGSR